MSEDVLQFQRFPHDISFAKGLALHNYAHPIANVMLPFKRFRFQRIQTSSDDVFVVFIHLVRCHSNRSMMSVIIRMHQVAQRIQITPCICIGEVTKHFLFQSSVETLHDGSLKIFVFTRVKLYTVTTQHGLKSRIKKFVTFVALHHVTLFISQNLFDVLSRLSSNWYHLASFARYVYAGE